MYSPGDKVEILQNGQIATVKYTINSAVPSVIVEIGEDDWAVEREIAEAHVAPYREPELEVE